MFGHYVDKVLQPGEQVRYRASLNWILYAPGAVLWLGAAILYLLPASGGLGTLAWLVALLLFAGGGVLIARAWFYWWTTDIAVTDRRIIYKTGFIRRKTTEMHMDKVESVDVEQSVLGRLLDYGDIVVRGTGTGLAPIRNIDAPLELRNHITGIS
jgi:uncharacterized membrane protein YdbT with pleckstrin-like domain